MSFINLQDVIYSRPKGLAARLAYVKKNASFQQDQFHVRDGVTLHLFVRHEGFDKNGKPLPEDGSSHPGKHSGSKQSKSNVNVEDDDPAKYYSSEGEEDIDYQNDADEPQLKVHTHRFTIDMVARYPDDADDLILHWGMSRQKVGAWGSPDQSFYPVDTQKWPDGLAAQTKFQRDVENRSIRTVTIVLGWVEEVDPSINSISFVLTEKNKNCWHSINGQDQRIIMCPQPEEENNNGEFSGVPKGPIGEVVTNILVCECKYDMWTLMHRYFKVKELISCGKIDIASRDHVVFFYIWLRYSFSKQLTWQRKWNTKPKELQHSQVVVTDELCYQYKNALNASKEEHHQRFLSAPDLIRAMLGFIGKGSGNGQAIRDEILHIMHRHKISERAGHFYEQWHQKLHNNTTPEDIPICEALIAYLKSGGDMSKYWDHLHKNGIDAKRLASYERAITTEPWYKPEAIGCFENYLHILKQVHSSDDLNMLINEAKGHCGGDTHQLMQDIQSNYKDHDALRQMDRVLALRYNLCHNHIDKNNVKKLKDILFLDLCLEAYTRQLTERIMHVDIGFQAYVREVSIIMQNLCLSYSWKELKYCKDDWEILVRVISKDLHEDNARKVKSVIDRLKQALGEVNDAYDEVMQTKAEMMGNHFGVADYAKKLFSEEVLRGTLFFSLSMILKKIDPHVRNCAHLGNWLIISQGRSHGSRGNIVRVKNLADVMHKVYDERSVLLVEKISGEEEVPTNVQAIVVLNASDYPDVLAHVSVRARNLKVLLTVLFDDDECNKLLKLEGRHIFLKVEGSNVKYEQQSKDQPIARRASSHLILQSAMDEAKRLEPPPMFKTSLMYMNEFNPKNSGAKSNNLKYLRDKLDSGIKLPDSAVIPFQVLEYSIGLDKNAQSKLNTLIDQIAKTKSVRRMNRILYQCKDLVLGLNFHENDQHHSFLKQQLLKFGIPSSDFSKAWMSIKKVWASKFNERAFLATKKLSVNLHQIFMAVLVQKIVPAEYAYVIHTTNPTNSNDQEVYVESCIGLGEALVSDMPGQALAFSYDKLSKQTKVNSYPNKSLALSSSGFIFRSDSNSEDLPGFAGAGLFDSYTMHEETKFRVSYNNERLVLNESFRNEFMKRIGYIGHHIERLYDDDPQDIEGAFYGGEYYVVQTRPQV